MGRSTVRVVRPDAGGALNGSESTTGEAVLHVMCQPSLFAGTRREKGMMSVEALDDVLAARDVMLKALRRQQLHRPLYRPSEWVQAELEVVTAAGNEWAERRGAPNRLTIERVRDFDLLAMGHVDWAEKLCLYAARWLCDVRD